MIVRLWLIVLGTVGLLIALYFTLVYYRILRPDFGLVPRVCRLDDRTCRSILSTKEGKLFGIPNAVLGLLFYGIIVWVTADGTAAVSRATLSRLLIVSLITVITSIYLAYALIFKRKLNCPLCFASHVINVAIFILLIIQGS